MWQKLVKLLSSLLAIQYVTKGATASYAPTESSSQSYATIIASYQAPSASVASCPNYQYLQSNLLVPTCYLVTRELIENYIVGARRKKDIATITQQILAALAIHPVIEEYISIVFNHLPGFQIILRYDANSMHQASYYPGLTTLYFNANFPLLMNSEAILHEFRHAFWHTLHLNRATADSLTVESYYPATAKAAQKFAGLFDIGTNRALTLSLKELRAMSTPKNISDVYHNYYTGRIDLLTSDFFNNQPVSVGQQLTLTTPAKQSLAIEILGFITRPNMHRVVVKKLEIALALKYFAADIDSQALKVYPPHHYLKEKDALLYSNFPIPLLAKIYTELVAYQRTIIDNTDFHLTRADKAPLGYLITDKEMFIANIKRVLALPAKAIEDSVVQNNIQDIALLIEQGQVVDRCQRFLTTVVKKKLPSREQAQKLLDNITFFKKASPAATTRVSQAAPEMAPKRLGNKL